MQESMTNYIFVTGGVVSSIGKGIAVASIGRMLKSMGLSVSLLKLDPYLNVDPGTMSPYQHGEVYVTNDGSETDLDLGHYERFVDVDLTGLSSVTAGQIYQRLIGTERKGVYLGYTIQIVPHVTDEIKRRIKKLARESRAEVVVVEVGGTVGDIEGQPFLEAIRQMRSEEGTDKTFYIHLTYVPFLKTAGEFKTKPTQHSVQALRSAGIQPDSIICRSEDTLRPELKEKISLYCDIPKDNVISMKDLKSIYQAPSYLEEAGFGKMLANAFNWEYVHSRADGWEKIIDIDNSMNRSIKIAIVGKYSELPDAYISVYEAIRHASAAQDVNPTIHLFSAQEIEELIKKGASHKLDSVSGIIVPGGFDHSGTEGMIYAAQYAREKKVPYLGLCLGMQVMITEYARNVLNIAQASSAEFTPNTPDPVVCLIPGQKGKELTGGSMRLGGYECTILEPSIARSAYGTDKTVERHRHRYEVNNAYLEQLARGGMRPTGIWEEGNLAEIMEVEGHPFMLGTQFHPEFKSRPDKPHPLFSAFIKTAKITVPAGSQISMFNKQLNEDRSAETLFSSFARQP